MVILAVLNFTCSNVGHKKWCHMIKNVDSKKVRGL